jgi:hypothetical protein
VNLVWDTTLSTNANIYAVAPHMMVRPMCSNDLGGLPRRLQSDICRVLKM